MVRLTCSAALGTGCLIGPWVPALGAQWSFAPTVAMGIVDDSNPYLTTGLPASESATLNPSAVLQYSTETVTASVTPWLSWQRMGEHAYADVDNRSLNGSLGWQSERGQLAVQASISDYSTLSSALTQTGFIAYDVRQRTSQAAGTWSWQQTEVLSTVLQATWLEVNYYGANSYLLDLLRGYKYPGLSVGERFTPSERTTFTLSAFGDESQSALPGSDSRQFGLQLEYLHHFTERTSLDAYAGGSERSLDGQRSTGALGGLTLSVATLRGHLDLNYANSLQPYASGLLAKRQSLTVSDTESLTEKLDLLLSLARIDNSQTVVELGIDRRYYDQATAGLNWHFAEHWLLGAQAGYTRSETLPGGALETPHPVSGWRGALNLSWTPRAIQRSF